MVMDEAKNHLKKEDGSRTPVIIVIKANINIIATIV